MFENPLSLLSLGMLIVVVSILAFRWHPFVALICAALVVAFLTPESSLIRSQVPSATWEKFLGGGSAALDEDEQATLTLAQAGSEKWFVTRVMEAFGKACGGIGLIIAMAAIIGKCLLDSGAARRIVDSLIRLFGLRGTPVAFAASSFTLGIPVFFDTVFYLLMPLGKALRRKTGKDYLLYILTIVAGATMAHSLVPPTPGPLTVAGFFEDEVTIGSMMLGGLIVGLFTVSAGIGFAYWANRRWKIPLREDLQSPEEVQTNEENLPSLAFSLAPIILPVLLIAGLTIAKAVEHAPSWLLLIGDKNIALLLSAGIAICLLTKFRRDKSVSVRESIQVALASGGVIILVTAAGSAFGATLKDTGIASEIGRWMGEGEALSLIWIAYGITALVRTAQGSATVAMITAGGIVAPLASGLELPYSALYLALAIGCGSKPISWANDSGFWVIGRMSGMTPLETFKTVSVMMIVMSLVGLLVLTLGAAFLPLA